MDSTLLNELTQAGPWLLDALACGWLAAVVFGGLWIRAKTDARAWKGAAKSIQDQLSNAAAWEQRRLSAAKPHSGHFGILYYPNNTQIQDSTGLKRPADAVAIEWARSIVKNTGILCLPRGVFSYETHPVPSRVECESGKKLAEFGIKTFIADERCGFGAEKS